MTEKETKKNLARDVDAFIAAEKLHQNFRELINAGFTDQQALIYLATLIGYITVNKKKKRGK